MTKQHIQHKNSAHISLASMKMLLKSSISISTLSLISVICLVEKNCSISASSTVGTSTLTASSCSLSSLPASAASSFCFSVPPSHVFTAETSDPHKTPYCTQLPTHLHSLFVGCLTSHQHASVYQGWICSDNFTCCHTEIEVVDQTFHLTQSQYTDTGPTSPSTDPIPPSTWQGSHWVSFGQTLYHRMPSDRHRQKKSKLIQKCCPENRKT